jgi:glycosyltransferase involved in cell wall biosynthesis
MATRGQECVAMPPLGSIRLAMQPISASIITYNSERTLGACLDSVSWADEIVVLDSGSTDSTLEIARSRNCVVRQQKFLGYGRQRQTGWEMAQHRWVLVLDSDEVVSPGLAQEIQELRRRGLEYDGYRIPRLEQLYWRMASRYAHVTFFLRLFDRTKARMTDSPIHAVPVVEGTIGRLQHPIRHYSKADIHGRVDTANNYSTDLVLDRVARGKGRSPWICIFYPPFYFLRSYVLHRQFLNGWAGFFASALSAMYVFLKYAKVYEHRCIQRHGNRLLPDPIPSLDRRRDRRPA